MFYAPVHRISSTTPVFFYEESFVFPVFPRQGDSTLSFSPTRSGVRRRGSSCLSVGRSEVFYNESVPLWPPLRGTSAGRQADVYAVFLAGPARAYGGEEAVV